MASGLQTLHDIDTAISKARRAVTEASALPKRAAKALADVQRARASAYDQIAKDRIALIEAGSGGDLGYVDRQAEKLLDAHDIEEARLSEKIDASLAAISDIEARRRAQESAVTKAVDIYDKAVSSAEAKILKDPDYQAAVKKTEDLAATALRAQDKLTIAQQDETTKGEPYRNDPFFAYLSGRQYGTRDAKGWFLTKALDGWVARISNYRKAAENYRRLTAIPVRLAAHVALLERNATAQDLALQKLEDEMLRREGVHDLHEASMKAQQALDAIDQELEAAETAHQDLRAQHTAMTSGQSGPYNEAIALLSETLARKDLPSLRRLAAQTQTRSDDAAIEDLRELSRTAKDLRDDQSEAVRLVKKYQRTLSDLENVRRRFKQRRYDAPSSSFKNDDLIMRVLGQLLVGAISGNDLWRTLERAQRTLKRYSDTDFGGIDWTEGLRLPRNTGGFGGTGGGWGGSGSGGCSPACAAICACWACCSVSPISPFTHSRAM